ncbi:phage tail sheath family protein [Vibrio cyclitrophicus]
MPLFIGYTEKAPEEKSAKIENFADYERLFGREQYNGSSILYYSVKHFFDNGGKGGFVYSLGTHEDLNAKDPQEILTDLHDPTLIHYLDSEKTITLLAFPDVVLLPSNYSDMDFWSEAWERLLVLSLVRTNLFAVLDAPDDAGATVYCLESLTSYGETGAAYWPFLKTQYTNETGTVTLPPSGAVLAAMQASDEQMGPWVSPANIKLSQVLKPTQGEYLLVSKWRPDLPHINIIKSFPGRGIYIWGARTLAKNPHTLFQYINARRLLSYCEHELSAVVRPFVFEENNELTWYQVKGLVYAWLFELWQAGGLYGAEEEEAFQVSLGLDETMTQEDLHQGKMILRVALATLVPAEFIELTLTLDMNGDGFISTEDGAE